jgi:hypothetical protein
MISRATGPNNDSMLTTSHYKSKVREDFYPVKIYFLTIVATPLLTALFCVVSDPSNAWVNKMTGFFAVMVFLVSVGVSMPFLAIYWLVFDFLKKKQIGFIPLRIVLCTMSVLFISLSLSIFWTFLSGYPGFIFGAAYIGVNIAATWFVKFRDENTKRDLTADELHS